MKKGQSVICKDNDNNSWLSVGTVYKVVSAHGQRNMFGQRHTTNSFEIIDDDGDMILNSGLKSPHGEFEVSDEA